MIFSYIPITRNIFGYFLLGFGCLGRLPYIDLFIPYIDKYSLCIGINVAMLYVRTKTLNLFD